MPKRIFESLPDFGFTRQQLEILHPRLQVPQFVYVSGPAGGGKTTAALMLAWAYFQRVNRPFRADGQDMTTTQVREAATAHTAGILFNDMAAPQDYMKAGYCLDCRMVSFAIAFDGPAIARQAYAYLLAYLPGLASRDDVTVIAVEEDPEAEVERYRVDLLTS
ncbi:ATP-binding protein [Ferrovibrio sp.]|uniref:ATP-binding protein n=1 Tax=Ferrovibrio sp. TaxID=1917215 RepID=UPI00311F36D9